MEKACQIFYWYILIAATLGHISNKLTLFFVACPAPAAAVLFSRLDRRKGVRRNYYDRLPGLFRNHTDRAGYDVVPRVFVAVGEMWSFCNEKRAPSCFFSVG